MRYRLVLAEDEPASAENVRDIIRIYCPQFELVAAAENGAECLELVRKYHPDLVLTDIKMPVMNGLELIRLLYEDIAEIKVRILSGYPDFDYARTAIQHGVIDYLLKPITPNSLQATLNRIVPLINNIRGKSQIIPHIQEIEQPITKIDTPEFFGLIEEYVKFNLKEPLSLQQVCMHIGISQTYMSRLFRKYTGLSFSNYLTRIRIEFAKQYLSSGKTMIKDAAALAGFKDQFYFSKVFKSYTGLSPSDYISGIQKKAKENK